MSRIHQHSHEDVQIAIPDNVIHLPAVINRWITDWLLEKRSLSNSQETKTTYARIIEDYRTALQQEGLDLDRLDRLSDLLSVALHSASESARGKPLKSATIRLRYAVLSSFYRFCMRQGLLAFNPIDRIQRPRPQRKQGARPLNTEEVAEKIAAIPDLNTDSQHVRADLLGLLSARDEALLLVYLETCRRLSEIAHLTWSDVRISKWGVDCEFAAEQHPNCNRARSELQ
jgi:integrase